MTQKSVSGSLAQKKLLVVDDDPLVSQLLGKVLVREGAELVTKHDGADALEYLSEHHCDLAIVDLIMPNVDGLRLISVLRQMSRTKHLPIVVITSRRDQEARESAERLGVSLFITKPIRWAQIAGQLSGALSVAHQTA